MALKRFLRLGTYLLAMSVADVGGLVLRTATLAEMIAPTFTDVFTDLGLPGRAKYPCRQISVPKIYQYGWWAIAHGKHARVVKEHFFKKILAGREE
eukprot:9615597-Karenia_brevis.AAC.1